MKKTALILAMMQLLIAQILLSQGGSGDEMHVPFLQIGTIHHNDDSDDEFCSSSSSSIDVEKKKKEEKTPRSEHRIMPRLKLSPEQKKSPEKNKKKSKKRSKSFSEKLSGSARSLLSPKNSIKKEKEQKSSRDISHIASTEEALARLHEMIHIDGELIALRPTTLIERVLRLTQGSYENEGRSEFTTALTAINELISPTIPSQRDRVALNLLYSLLQRHVMEALINDFIMNGTHSKLFLKAFKNRSHDAQNTVNWHDIIEERTASIINTLGHTPLIQALHLIALYYTVNALYDWEDQDIKEELLTIAHVFYIQIPTHEEIEIKDALDQIEDLERQISDNETQLEEVAQQAQEAKSLMEKINKEKESQDEELQKAIEHYRELRSQQIKLAKKLDLAHKTLIQEQMNLVSSKKKLLIANILSSEIYLILSEIGLPTLMSNAIDGIKEAQLIHSKHFS